MPVYFFNTAEYEILKELYPDYYLEVLVDLTSHEVERSAQAK